MSQLYDQIGVGYRALRRPDPRIAAAIVGALGLAAWARRHGHVLELENLDLGYRVVIGS